MGCVSGLGSNVASAWDAAIAGQGGIRPIKRYAEGQQDLAFEGIGAPALADALTPLRARFSEKQLSGVDPFSAFGAAATLEALTDAGLAGDTAALSVAAILYGRSEERR